MNTYHLELSAMNTDIEELKPTLIDWFDDFLQGRISPDDMREQAGILFDSLRQMPDHVCKCSCASSSDICDCECDCDFGQDIIAIRTTLKKLELKVDALTGARPAA